MTNDVKLSSIQINPAEKADKCVIWLHGLGADGNDFVPIVPELHLPSHLHIRFIFPNAPVMPVTINGGHQMPAWFDIYHPDIQAKIDEAGIARAVAMINTLIRHEEELGIDSTDIMLAGFSQGAAIALTTGILYPKPLAGIIALSGLLPRADTIIQQGSDANRTIPVFMAHGTQDQIIPLQRGQASYTTLKSASYPIEWHDYPMAHSVSPAEINDISRFIQNIWK